MYENIYICDIFSCVSNTRKKIKYSLTMKMKSINADLEGTNLNLSLHFFFYLCFVLFIFQYFKLLDKNKAAVVERYHASYE